MPWLLIIAGVGALALFGLLSFWLIRTIRADKAYRQFSLRIKRLGWRDKLRLARRIVGDRRVPWTARLVPAGVVLYLAMPLDIIPDFLPVIGQLDDLLVLALGAWLLVRLTPGAVLGEHLDRLESEAGGQGGAAQGRQPGSESPPPIVR